jgi:F0F1-type ATP synthase assembly protein I
LKNKNLKTDSKIGLQEKGANKLKFIAKSTSLLSLGISMVVAVILGVALGIFLKNITGINGFLFLGIFFGVAASFLNVYKVYKSQVKEYEEEDN